MWVSLRPIDSERLLVGSEEGLAIVELQKDSKSPKIFVDAVFCAVHYIFFHLGGYRSLGCD